MQNSRHACSYTLLHTSGDAGAAILYVSVFCGWLVCNPADETRRGHLSIQAEFMINQLIECVWVDALCYHTHKVAYGVE
jgi:hypothetical protein